jgi:probable HAF family extracellular repeat protein
MSTDVAAFLDRLELRPGQAVGHNLGTTRAASPQGGRVGMVTVVGQLVGRSDDALQVAVGPSTLEIVLADVLSIERAGRAVAPVSWGGAPASDAVPGADGRAAVVRIALRSSASVLVQQRLTAGALGIGSHLLPAIPARLVRPRRPAVPQPRNGKSGVEAGMPGLVTVRHQVTLSRTRAGLVAEYDAVDLGPLPPYASHTYVVAINNLGQVVGYAYEPGFPHSDAVLWTERGTDGPPENPQLRGLGNFAGDDYWHSSEAFALNNRGQVVGWANGTDILLDPWHAFVWQAGKMTDLGTLEPYGWGSSMARSITDNGLIAGWSQTAPGDSMSGNPHAFVYDMASSQLFDVGVDESWANSINAAGQVVGAYTSASGDKHALYWDATIGGRDLHELVSAGGSISEAASINDAGLIVGWGTDADGTSRAFCCDLATGQVQHVGGEGESLAFSVNNAGTAVGRFQYERPSLYDHALVWDPAAGVAQALGDLLGEDSGWNLEVAWSINDAGQIAGYGGHHVNDDWRASSFRLTPRS